VAEDRYRIQLIEGVPVITAPAVIKAGNAHVLQAALERPAALGLATVVVDLSSTRGCDAAGLAALVRAHRGAIAEGGDLRLAGAAGRVRAAIAAAGLDGVFRQYDTVCAAVAELPAAAIETCWVLTARLAS